MTTDLALQPFPCEMPGSSSYFPQVSTFQCQKLQLVAIETALYWRGWGEKSVLHCLIWVSGLRVCMCTCRCCVFGEAVHALVFMATYKIILRGYMSISSHVNMIDPWCWIMCTIMWRKVIKTFYLLHIRVVLHRSMFPAFQLVSHLLWIYAIFFFDSNDLNSRCVGIPLSPHFLNSAPLVTGVTYCTMPSVRPQLLFLFRTRLWLHLPFQQICGPILYWSGNLIKHVSMKMQYSAHQHMG